MDEEKKEAVKEKVEEAKATIKVASKAASGDYIGAAKDAIKSGLLKKATKRYIIVAIIKFLLPIIMVLLIVGCQFAIYEKIKDTMVDIITSPISATKGFFANIWNFLTGGGSEDYWIDLDKTEKEYVIDTRDGKTIAYKDDDDKYIIIDKNNLITLAQVEYNKAPSQLSDDEVKTLTEKYLDAIESQYKTTKKYNIIDTYTKQLGDQGISLESLRMIGENSAVDESPFDDAVNKLNVQKYIGEFIKADIITQQIHKTKGMDVVNPLNHNQIDGGIYIYRDKSVDDLGLTVKDVKDIDGTKILDVEKENYYRLEYVPIDDFEDMIAANNLDARYKFSVDKVGDEEKVVLAEVKRTITEKYDIPKDSDWFEGIEDQHLVGETGSIQLVRKDLDYKNLVSKYVMPYEFLVNLCQITQNPEFVYHVALLARDTQIILVVHDETDVDKSIVETHTVTTHYHRDGSDGGRSGATKTEKSNVRIREVTTTITENPKLDIKSADTWSFYDYFKYQKVLKKNRYEENPVGDRVISDESDLPGTLEHHHTKDPDDSTDKEYWYDTQISLKERGTLDIELDIEYKKLAGGISKEKSKQFLGLLRNKDGKCPNDCYLVDPVLASAQAHDCAEKAEFNLDGINVTYIIPGTNKKESPLNMIQSGLEQLYAVLQSNTSGFTSDDYKFAEGSDDLYNNYYTPDGIYSSDGKSAYVVKMQGIVQHLRYLFNYNGSSPYGDFPPNESYTKQWKVEAGDYWGGGGWYSPEYDPGVEIPYVPEDPDNPGKELDEKDPNAIAWAIWCAARNAGLSEEAAAGILGNIDAESRFNPEAFNPGGGGIGAYGLAQWRADRQRRLKDYAKTSKVSVEIQINYLIGEILGNGACNSKFQLMPAYKSNYEEWKSATTPEIAGANFCKWFERPGSIPENRKTLSRKWYDRFAGKTPSTPKKPSSGVDEDYKSSGNAIVQKAATCMQYLKDHNYVYGQPPSPWPPTGSNGKMDCSGYVSWVLKELGYLDSRWTSATFAANKNNWTKITDKSQVKAGDILVYYDDTGRPCHVDICASDVTDTSKVTKFNCGDTSHITTKSQPYTGGWRSGFEFALRIN